MKQSAENQEFTRLGGVWGADGEDKTTAIEKLENYNYFDGSSIRQSVEIPAAAIRDGCRLWQQGKIEIEEISSGFDRVTGEPLGQVTARGKNGRDEFPIRITFSRTKVIYSACSCPKCRRDYYSWHENKTSCPYKAGLLTALEEYLSTHNIGDMTDSAALSLLRSFHRKQTFRMMADAGVQEGSLKLMPRLTRKEERLFVSFRVGASKLFVVKRLDDFCRNVRVGATDVYGSNTELNHSMDNFTPEGKSWIRFIERIVQEEEAFSRRLWESRNYQAYRQAGVGSSIELFGWRLDEFYGLLADGAVEFEDKDAAEKKKGTLRCGSGNPRVTMRISQKRLKNDREFHGITVSGTLPKLYFGSDTAYYIGDDMLLRVDKSFLEKIEPLTGLAAKNDSFRFQVGRNNLAEFYYRVLPELEDVVDVSETEPEKFRSYLPPEAHFIYYLDAPEGDVTCRVSARYGDIEIPVTQPAYEEGSGVFAGTQDARAGGNEPTAGTQSARKGTGERAGAPVEWRPFRDAVREQEALYLAAQWFPAADAQTGALCCGGDEELVYRVMKSGVAKLMENGEVQCTKRFLNYRVVNRVRVSVGVSVSSGMLDLKISSEDVPQQELLELLAGYRLKKKYYRLKDGSFVDMEDTSLKMLSELTEAMHVKPKDFLRGNLQLPMYRTLYLDRLLEENEGVYSSRDSRFREMVKGFKTVKDADFEEPASLSGIMRGYQKNGYKWLRTLENWRFGGILADDMGLGKTVQAIAVLLAAKEEAQAGRTPGQNMTAAPAPTALVVAPASLVFNWGEELARFAPQLTVCLVTGTQEERREKIARWREADVLVTSYDLLKRDVTQYEDKQFRYEIIDEAQYIKNHATAAARAVKAVKSEIRFALTGTPIENRLSELWSIFDYLMPGFLYSYETFRRELETPIVKNGDEDARRRLQRMAGPFILRRLKEDVLEDLPEKLEEIRYVRLGGEQQKLYDAQVLHMKEGIAGQSTEEFNKNKMKILAELTRLRQICCDPSLCFENYHGGAAKVEAVLDLIRSAADGGHRILLFSQFTSMLEILQRELNEAGISYETITGATSKEKRLQRVKAFNEGSAPVFLISLKAGGVGLNLTGADVVIHYDPWWNLAVQNQATDRAHRIGQTRKVTVYKLLVKNSIEEKIQQLQETKKDLADQIVGSGGGQPGQMSREELLELLEL